MATVSIIIPHYNDVERLNVCLQALHAQLPVDGHEVEVLVCDNNSSQDLSATKAKFSMWTRFLNEARPGAAHARNLGASESKGDILLFTDADCVPDGNWIRKLTEFVRENDYSGGRIELFSEHQFESFNPYDQFERIFAFKQRSYVEEKNFAATANMGVLRSTFLDIGDFDNETGEDFDWGQRAKKLGIRCSYTEDASVKHPTRADWQGLWKKWRRLTIEDYQNCHKKGLNPLRMVFRAVLIAFSPVIHLRSILATRGLSVFEMIKVAGVLVGLRAKRSMLFLRLAITGRKSV
ncbi:MAG: glycosyltransferase [Pseudomonadota bacterium]